MSAKQKETVQIYQLWDYEQNEPIHLDPENLIFSEPERSEIPPPPNAPKNAKPIVNFTIPFSVKHPDGSIGKFIFETDECLTFGVSENISQTTGQLDGYSLSVKMINQNEPTEAQKHIVHTINNVILPALKKALLAKAEKVGKRGLLEANLTEEVFKILNLTKDENGNIDESKREFPTLYPKLICSKKKGMKIYSRFFLMGHQDSEGNSIELDPLKLVGQRGLVKAYVTLDSIFVGTTVLSVRKSLRECYFKPIESTFKQIAQPKKETLVTINPMDSAASALLLIKNQAPAHTIILDDQKGQQPADNNQQNGDNNTQQPATTFDPYQATNPLMNGQTIIRRTVTGNKK